MTPKQQYYENIGKTLMANLEKRQMEGYYCPDRKSAVEKALELMPDGSSIGWGGSMTLSEIGLMEALKEGAYTLIDRDSATSKEEQKALYGQMSTCDFFMTGTNAITIDGELINMDARGNRVAFLCFGPETVLVFVGMNKIVPDRQSGMLRVQNIASPPNTVRLKKKTPCAITGKCGDCYSPESICSQLMITRRSGVPGRIKVILIGEELGY